MAANKIQVGYIEPQDGAQFKVDEGTAAAPGICFVDSAATGLYSPGTGQLAFSTSSKQTALRILADGKVGIDCSPTVALEVNGTIKATAIDAPIEGTLDDWIVHAGDTNTKIGFPDADQFQVQTGGSPRLTVTNAAVTATGLLTVEGGSGTQHMFKHSAGWGGVTSAGSAGGSGAGFSLANNYSGTLETKWSIYLDGSNDGLRFTANTPDQTSDEKLRITSDGKVGIGVADPAGLLEIEGNVSSTTQFSGFDGLRVHNANGSAHGVTADMYFTAGTSSQNRGAAIGVEFVSGSSGNDLYFATNPASVTSANTLYERLRIKADGNILQTKTGGNVNFTLSRNESVGTTNQALGVIDFASNTAHTVQARLMAKSLGTSNVGGDLVVETRASGGSLDERVRITGSGELNIGGNYTQTTAPLAVTTSANDFGYRLLTGSNVVCDILNNNSSGDCEIRGYKNNNSGTRGEGFRLEANGDSFFTGGRLLVGTTTNSISSSELFEVKSTGSGFSHFRNNHSGYATIYIDNEYSDTGYAPFITFTDGGGNRGGIGQDQNDLLRIHGQGGVEFFTNGTHGGGTQTAKFSSSSGESYLTIVGDKAPAGTGGNLILQNKNTTTLAASTVQFADTGGQTISAINGVCVDHSTNEGLLTFHTRAANGAPTERLRLAASNHIHMFNPAANGADRLNILGGGDGISIARANGANASDGNILGNLSFHSYTSGSYHANAEAKIEAIASTIANQTNSGSNAPTDLLFYTKDTGYGPGSAPSEKMRIHAQGVVRAKYGVDEQNNNGTSFYSANTGFLGSQFTNWGPLFPFFYLGEYSSGSGSTSFHALDSYASHHWGGFPRMMIFGHYRYYGAGFSAWTYGNYGGASHVGDLYLVSGWGGYGASHAGSLPSSQTGSGINCSVTQTRTNNVAVHSGANVHRWKLEFNTSGAHIYIRWYVGFMGVGRGLYTSETSQADVTSSCSNGGCVHLRTMNRNHFRNCTYLD